MQLLQLAGIREVLVVTGKGHAGQMIDLLGDGHLTVRGGDAPLLELDLSYKVQTAPGGIAEVVGMAEDFAGGEPLVVVLGDNIFEYSHAAEIAAWGASGGGAQVFVKDVPDPENFGVVVYDEAGAVIDLSEKAGIVDLRYPSPPDERCGRRAVLLSAGRLLRDREPRALEPRRARDHRREPRVRPARRALRRAGARLVGGRGQALAASRRDRPHDRRDGREQVSVDGIVRIPLRRFEDERGWFCELRRESLLPNPTVQTNVSFSRRGRDPRAPLPRARPGRPVRLHAGHGPRRRPRPGTTGATFTEDIGDENPVALYIPGRHAHGFEALTDLLFVYHVTEEYDPADPDEHGIPWDDPRVKGLWSTATPTLSARDQQA